MSIKIKNLSFSYGERLILNDLSFDIYQGEFIAIMGLSGCGKTTLLRLLLGLNAIQKGSIELDGLNYENGLEVIRNLVSYIPQHGALYPHMTVEKNILLPLQVKRKINDQDNQKMLELAKTCNISSELFKRYPNELSGGQRQRVSVLRALMMDTPYIFLDEPLSALDPITKVSVQKEFKSIFKSANKTIIMVTHALNEAKFLCDKLLILNNGKIEQFDHYQELVSKPKTSFAEEFIQSQI